MHSVVLKRTSLLKRGPPTAGSFLEPTVTEVPRRRGERTGAPLRAKAPEDRNDEDLVAAMVVNEPWAWKEFQRRYDRLIHRCITKVTRRFTGSSWGRT